MTTEKAPPRRRTRQKVTLPQAVAVMLDAYDAYTMELLTHVIANGPVFPEGSDLAKRHLALSFAVDAVQREINRDA